MKGSWESLVIQKWSWQAAPGDSDKGHSFSQQTCTPILCLSFKFPTAVSLNSILLAVLIYSLVWFLALHDKKKKKIQLIIVKFVYYKEAWKHY